MNKMINKLNGTRSINNLEYFGTYRGIEWTLRGERDGSKVWWYLTDNEGENPMPAENLKDALICMIGNIDYYFNN